MPKDNEVVTKVGEAELMDGDGSVHLEVEHTLSSHTFSDGDTRSYHYAQIKGCVSHYGYTMNYELPAMPLKAVLWLIEALTKTAEKMGDCDSPGGAFEHKLQLAVQGSDKFQHRIPTWEERIASGEVGSGTSSVEEEASTNNPNTP